MEKEEEEEKKEEGGFERSAGPEGTEGIQARDCDLGLRLQFELRRQGRGGTEQKEEEEKIPYMCKSIGHQTPRGRFLAPSLNYNHNPLK